MTYEFRAASGDVCCATSNPNHLCAACKVRFRTQRVAPNAALLTTAEANDGVPDPPSLLDALLAQAARTAPVRLANTNDHNDEAPPPIDMAEALRNHRKEQH